VAVRRLLVILLLLLHDCQGARPCLTRAARPAPVSSGRQAMFPFTLRYRQELLARITIPSHSPSTADRLPVRSAEPDSEMTESSTPARPGPDILHTQMSFQL